VTSSVSGNVPRRSCFRIFALICCEWSALVHWCSPRSAAIVTQLVTRLPYWSWSSISPIEAAVLTASAHLMDSPGFRSCRRRRAASPYLCKSSGSTSGGRLPKSSSGVMVASLANNRSMLREALHVSRALWMQTVGTPQECHRGSRLSRLCRVGHGCGRERRLLYSAAVLTSRQAQPDVAAASAAVASARGWHDQLGKLYSASSPASRISAWMPS
jgi:hypothetical protein